jgi:hypothetical protein
MWSPTNKWRARFNYAETRRFHARTRANKRKRRGFRPAAYRYT